MKDNCLYSTRATIFDVTGLFYLILSVICFSINATLGILLLILFFVWIVGTLATRVELYSDRLVYKTGLIFKTTKRTLLLKSVASIDYNCNIFGRVLGVGDVVISSYNDKSSVCIRNVKKAKMFVENVQSLLSNS